MASPGSIVIQAVVDSAKATRDAAALALGLGKVDKAADTLDTSLGSAERAMDNTGRAGRDTARDLEVTETALDQVGDEADQLADRLRTSANRMVSEVNAAAGGVEREADGMRTNLGELGRESGAEFVGNIAEGIGSGQANLQDVVSGTLGGLTNLAATLSGPVGIAAGAAAAGIGLVFAAVKGESEKAQAAIDNLRGAMDSVWDKGQEIQEQAIFDAWVEGAQETTGKLENTRDVLAQAGVTAEEFKSALAGDPEAMDVVKGKINAQADAIEDAKTQQGGLYDFQQKYLDSMGGVIGDIEESDRALGAVRREHEAIEDLSGKTGGNIGQWNTDDAIADAKKLNTAIDNATRNRTVHVTLTGEGVGQGLTGPGAGAGGPRAATQAAPTNVTINMQGAFNDPLGNARTIKRLLEQGDLRQGRERGTPLPVAWG